VVPIIAYVQCLNNEVFGNSTNSNNKNSIINFAGTKIHAIKMPEVLEKMSHWIKFEREKIHWIVVTGMHGIVEAHKNKEFKNILNSADLFVPDGISLVWLANLKGFKLKKRISGADLMDAFFAMAEKEGISSFFYGDSDDTLEKLQANLKNKYPNLKIAGSHPSHFRPLFSEEDKFVIEKINNAKPDVLWIARGLPKQERWIYRYRSELKVPVVVGVGAAFNFISGNVQRAPLWIGDNGFEWLWRLIKEPKRMWRRVFIDGPIFLWLVFCDFISGSSNNADID
jgi:N-acetylglucosaminyldiphosphoundecaprenol N-acetyl-beta-D-mannosaminyltransferase